MSENEKPDQDQGEPLVYCYGDAVSPSELFVLLDKMELQEGTRFPASAVFHRSLRDEKREASALESSVCVTARSGGELVGFLRVVTDGVYIFYILDVMVDPAMQGRGTGRRLVELARDKAIEGGFMKLFLTAIPGAEAFYESMGFKPSMSPVLTMRGEDFVEG